jgi:hypothetical protein
VPDLVEQVAQATDQPLVEEVAQQQAMQERVALVPDQPPVEEVAQQQVAQEQVVQEQVVQEQVAPVAGPPLVEDVGPPLLQRPLEPIKLMELLVTPS